MSPRTGRPPKENPRNVNLNIRVSKDEAEMLQRCAEKLGTTRTEIIIKGVKMVEAEMDKKKIEIRRRGKQKRIPICTEKLPSGKSILS